MNTAFRASVNLNFYWGNAAYSYHFNGQEKDDEVYGKGNSTSAEFWQYDTRLGRRFNLDPKPNSSVGSYVCFYNSPIWFCDINGDTSKVYDMQNNLLETINDPGKTRYVQVDAARYWSYKHNYASKEGATGANFYSQVVNDPEYAANYINSFIKSEQQLGRERSGDFTTYVTVGSEPPWMELVPIDYADQEPSNADNLQTEPPANMYVPPPRTLPGFPDAEKIKSKGGRARWRLPNGETLEWDSQHGDLERYSKGKKHKGSWDKDGKQTKGPVKGRPPSDFAPQAPVPQINHHGPMLYRPGAAPSIGGPVLGGAAGAAGVVELLPILILF